jgi:hypothetical protein
MILSIFSPSLLAIKNLQNQFISNYRMIICVVTLQHFVSKQCIIAIRVGFSSIAHMHIQIQTLSL